MKERIAILDGVRTPMIKAGGAFKGLGADALGVLSTRALLSRNEIPLQDYNEVIFGNVAQPTHAANVARVIALRSGLLEGTIASTVHRNCASGMEALSAATNRIRAGEGSLYLCGGVESMSNIPLLYNHQMRDLFGALFKARSFYDTLRALSYFRPHFLKPIIGLEQGLTDPISGMMMGNTAEVLAKEFGISRYDQDHYALTSHQKAEAAIEAKRFHEEIIPVVPEPLKGVLVHEDNGVRKGISMEQLGRLKPYFEKRTGTVTAGNSSQLTDASAAMIVTSESHAKALGIKPLGYLRAYRYAGLDPKRMGLGPVYATREVLRDTGLGMEDFDLIELNEAFAAQVLANVKAFASKAFAAAAFGDGYAVGEIDPSRLNVNGGAIALGHPVGMSGARLIITLLYELRRRGAHRGLATLCIGGGQGASFVMEVE